MNSLQPIPKFFVIIGTGLLLCLIHTGLFSQSGTQSSDKSILVMPFKVNPAEEMANQWLGRAVSFYLTAGLQSNGLNIVPDHRMASILKSNHILFPYDVSKASVMKLARQHPIKYVVWGDITLEPIESKEPAAKSEKSNSTGKTGTPPLGEKESLEESNNESIEKSMEESVENREYILHLKGYIIDLDSYSQRYLPILKGHINGLYKIKNEFLSQAIRFLKPEIPEQKIYYPRFKLNLRNYELFIKSLLIKDSTKRFRLLEKVKNATEGEDSDLLNIELAALFYEDGDWEAAEGLLDKIPVDKESPLPLFQDRKVFLLGLIDYGRENIAAAAEAFEWLQQRNRYIVEVNHNLGVIHFKRRDFKDSITSFQQALAEEKDPETWFYLIYALLFDNDFQQAGLQLRELLRSYPDEEKPIRLLSYFMTKEENKTQLFYTFQRYIPNIFLDEKLPNLKLKLKNPFSPQEVKPFIHGGDGVTDEPRNSVPQEDTDSMIEQLQGLLEINPFEPEYYRKIAQLYRKKKKYHDALIHAAVLVFLENTRENNLLLAKIYKAMGEKQKAGEIKKQAKKLN